MSNKEQQAMDIEVEKCDKEKEVIGAIKEEGDPAVSHSIGSGTDTFQQKQTKFKNELRTFLLHSLNIKCSVK